jgi:hypothetical protein
MQRLLYHVNFSILKGRHVPVLLTSRNFCKTQKEDKKPVETPVLNFQSERRIVSELLKHLWPSNKANAGNAVFFF